MEPHEDDLQQESEGFAESFAESDAEQTWYFDLPNGAWERQEEKNRSLRDSVRQNVQQSDARESAAAKRDPFRAKPNSGSKDARPSSWTLNRRTSGNLAEDPIAWQSDEEPDVSGPAPTSAWGPQPAGARGSDPLKLRPVRRDNDELPPAAPPVGEDENAGSVVDAMRGWSSLRKPASPAEAREPRRNLFEEAPRPTAPTGGDAPDSQAAVEPTGGWSSLRKKPAAAEGQESRWDQLFAPAAEGAGSSMVDSMREWASAPPPPDPDAMPMDINELPQELLAPFDWEEAESSLKETGTPARPLEAVWETPVPFASPAHLDEPSVPIAWEPLSGAEAEGEGAHEPAPPAGHSWNDDPQERRATGGWLDALATPTADGGWGEASAAGEPAELPQPMGWGSFAMEDEPTDLGDKPQAPIKSEPKKRGLFGKIFSKAKDEPKRPPSGPAWADVEPGGWLKGEDEPELAQPAASSSQWTAEAVAGTGWEVDEPAPTPGIAGWGSVPEEPALAWASPEAADSPNQGREAILADASPAKPESDDWDGWKSARRGGVERDMSGAALDEPLPVAELAANRFHFAARQDWNDDWLEKPADTEVPEENPVPVDEPAAALNEPVQFPASAWQGVPEVDDSAPEFEPEDERAVEAPLASATFEEAMAEEPTFEAAPPPLDLGDAVAPEATPGLAFADEQPEEEDLLGWGSVIPLAASPKPSAWPVLDELEPAPEPEAAEPDLAFVPARAFAAGWQEPRAEDERPPAVDLALPDEADSEPVTLHAEPVMENEREGAYPEEPEGLHPPSHAAETHAAEPTAGPEPPGPPDSAPDDPWAAFIRTREDDSEGPVPFASPATAETGAPVSWETQFAPGNESAMTPEPEPQPAEEDPWGAIVAASGYDEKPEHASVYLGKRDAQSQEERLPLAPLPAPSSDAEPFELPVPNAGDDFEPDFSEAPAPSASSAWYQDDEDDVVLRAFEEHARTEIRETAPQTFDDASDDAFEPLLGKFAAEIVEEASEPIERPFFAAAPSWDPPAPNVQQAPAPWSPPSARAFESEHRGWAEHDPAADVPPPFIAGTSYEDDFFGEDPVPLAVPAPKDNRGRTLVRELVETGLLALLVFLAVRASFQNFKVDGSSMFPTLEDGQFLIVNKLVYSEVDLDKMSRFLPFLDAGTDPKRHVFHPPQRGDIVVLIDPSDPKIDLIKRVVGLPGESIEIIEGRVYINDKQLAEPYIKQTWHGNNPKITIPAGEYFVMGDNRDNSQDSRSARVGLVPEELIIGKTFLSYWPMEQFGLAPNGSPRVTDVAAPRKSTEVPK